MFLPPSSLMEDMPRGSQQGLCHPLLQALREVATLCPHCPVTQSPFLALLALSCPPALPFPIFSCKSPCHHQAWQHPSDAQFSRFKAQYTNLLPFVPSDHRDSILQPRFLFFWSLACGLLFIIICLSRS